MGSRCCKRRRDKTTQVTPVPRDYPPPPIPKKSIGILVKLLDERGPAPAPGPVITMEKVDTSSMTRIAETTTFEEEIHGDIPVRDFPMNFPLIVFLQLEIDVSQADQSGKSKKPKAIEKEARHGGWDEKYFVHGELSEIVAQLKSQTHGCTASSTPEDIEKYLQMLHSLNTRATEILKKQITIISSKEKSRIDQVTIQRDVVNQTLIGNGNSYAGKCDDYYRKIIEEFIKQLEIEMSMYLDRLQQHLQEDRDRVFRESTKNVRMISEKADKARQDFYFRLQKEIITYRQQILELIDLSIKSSGTTLGYEQMKKIDLSIYSTVGHKEGEFACDQIPQRDKFVKDIDQAKKHQPMMKRTVFLSKDFHK